MAERLIDAELLKRTTKRLIKEQEQDGFYPKSWDEEVIAFKCLIDGMPTIEAKPVVHAHWLITEYEYFDCSNCGRSIWNGCDSTAQAKQMLVNKEVVFQYCPYCGAQMDEFAGDINVGSKTDHIAEVGKKEGE